MRTIKFLGVAAVVIAVVAVALVAVAMSAGAQANVPAGAFPGLDRMARFEARRLEQLQGRRFAGPGARRAYLRGRMAQRRGFAGRNRLSARGLGWGPRVGVRRDARLGGALIGPPIGLGPRIRAQMSPEQRALAQQFRAQRRAVRAQVLDGTLTREQARNELNEWRREHRAKR